MTRSHAKSGAWRQAARCVLAAAASALSCAAHAQFAGTLGVASVNRYRGMGTGDVGPVVRASATLDLLAGGYGGVSGLWHTRDAGMSSAEAMLGWSGRFDALQPEWGWDTAVHRTHYDGVDGKDFTEAMLGLLAPDFTLRSWFAPHYFGGQTHTFYTELDASHALDAHWRAFAHLGWLHYGSAVDYPQRTPDRTDTLVGIGATLSRWDFTLARDGIVAGSALGGLDARGRQAAWTLGASVAF